MFNPGDQVHFYSSVTALDVVMTVRYIISVGANGNREYLCCYLDDNHVIRQIEAFESELQIIP